MYITGKKGRNPNQFGLENDLTEETTIQVSENTTDIHINMGSDNDQVDTSNLEITVFRTSNRQKRVPITRKNDFYGKSHPRSS